MRNLKPDTISIAYLHYFELEFHFGHNDDLK